MGLKERREREKEARKGQILTAARSLLFKKGIQATSINQIARKAELGVGTIYFYYQSKEEIFYWLQEEGLDILFKTIDAIGRRRCPAGREASPDRRRLPAIQRGTQGLFRHHQLFSGHSHGDFGR
jgi:AcrR family transcriptional regulator